MFCEFTTEGQESVCTRCGKRLPIVGKPIRRKCSPLAAERRRRTPASIIPPRAGAELHKLLASVGITEATGCGCTAWRLKMDERGTAWSREHKTEIVEHLRESAKKTGWLQKAILAGRLLREDWFSTFSPLDSIVSEAIRRAEQPGDE